MLCEHRKPLLECNIRAKWMVQVLHSSAVSALLNAVEYCTVREINLFHRGKFLLRWRLSKRFLKFTANSNQKIDTISLKRIENFQDIFQMRRIFITLAMIMLNGDQNLKPPPQKVHLYAWIVVLEQSKNFRSYGLLSTFKNKIDLQI